MFRLESIEFKGHPQLGDILLPLADLSELNESAKPYTSVIIGANGTGKSYILRTIAELFRQIDKSYRLEKPEFPFSYYIKLQYHLDGDNYTILIDRVKGSKRTIGLAKNQKDIPLSEIKYPQRLIVNSVMLTDRFVWYNSQPEQFYQYLGIRSTSRSSSTQSSSRRTVTHLFNAKTSNVEFINKLRELLSFLDYEQSFKVNYKTKITKLFFSGNLNEKDFRQYFEYWWDENFTYTSRSQHNPIWSKPYYDNNFKGKPERVGEVVSFLNEISSSAERLHKIDRSDAKMISIDLLTDEFSERELQIIKHLENLDIVNLDGIKATKRNSTLSIEQMSSGEYHLLISLIGIFANIVQNSLVLIDEPEISLHPNWQMKYVTFLKGVFSKYSGSHFILTSHSHFIVSDLEGKNSSITGLKRNSMVSQKDIANDIEVVKFRKAIDTYGWSAEQVLMDVFKVPTTRNYYIAEKLGDILELVAMPNRDEPLIREKVQDLIADNIINLSSEDPLKPVLDKLIEKYG